MLRFALFLALFLALCLPATASAAETWTPPKTLDTGGRGVEWMDVATSPDGHTVAVWEQSDGISMRIYASRRVPGGDFTAPQAISPPVQNSYAPQVAVAAGGEARAVWTARPNGGARVQAALAPAGAAFGQIETVSDVGAQSDGPALAVNAAGDAALALVQYTGGFGTGRVRVALAKPGEEFGAPTAISTQGERRHLAIAINSAGAVLTAWERVDPSSRIEANLKPPGTAFTSYAIVSDPASAWPDVAIDAAGNGIIAWQGLNATTNKSQISYATVSAANVYSPPAPVSDPNIASVNAQIALTPSGEATLAWSGNGLRVTRLSPGGVWDAPLRLADPPYRLRVLADATEATTVLWETRALDTAYLSSARRRGAGALEPAQQVTPPDGSVALFAASADGQGNVVAGWTGYDGNYQRARVGALDVAGPRLELATPSAATTGAPATFAVSATDTWSAIAQARWSFGADGVNVEHAFATAGTYAPSVTVTDEVGNAATATAAPVVVTDPPPAVPVVVSDPPRPTVPVVVTDPPPPAARVDTTAPTVALHTARRGRRVRATVTCSEACTATVTLRRRGKLIARKTVRLSRAGSARRTLARTRARKLRVEVVATDLAGNASRPVRRWV